MVTLTKAEAKDIGLEYGIVCKFHSHHPDQTAIMETCEDCKFIRDPCGCGEDEDCELCATKTIIKMNKKKNYKSIGHNRFYDPDIDPNNFE